MRRWLFAAFALVVTAAPAAARTWVVDQYGAGDVRTIQAALDSVQIAPGPDTAIVRAGDYPEHLSVWRTFDDWLPADGEDAVVLCPDGPDMTTALNITIPALGFGKRLLPWTIRGMGYLEPVTFVTNDYNDDFRWVGCTFRAGFDGDGNGAAPPLSDCDLYGPVRLMYFNSVAHQTDFENLRFHRAPLTTIKQLGPLIYRNCRFEGGPGDTLATALSGEDQEFQGCTFGGGDVGLRIPSSYGGFNSVTDCRFTGLRVGLEVTTEQGVGPLYVSGCRFDDCAQAVRSLGGAIQMAADTLSGCGDHAIVPGDYAELRNLVVEGNRGVAVDRPPRDWGNLSVSNSTFRDVDSVAVRTRLAPGPSGSPYVYMAGNRFERCGSAAEIEAINATLIENVVFGCAGDGVRVTFCSGYCLGSITRNTFALNTGCGVVVATQDTVTWYSPLDLSRNIAARNGGEGFHVGNGVSCTLASNDAWQNGGEAYVGIAPEASNLELDPLFCGLAAGDLTVYIHSPAAPNTSTGPIGALGVGCDESRLGVPPSPAPSVAFSARPIPARGQVEFALPALAGSARIEVLDAQGRRVWSAPLEPGASVVRWQGERDAGGYAEAGVYWARLTGGATPRTTRFVWLR